MNGLRASPSLFVYEQLGFQHEVNETWEASPGGFNTGGDRRHSVRYNSTLVGRRPLLLGRHDRMLLGDK